MEHCEHSARRGCAKCAKCAGGVWGGSAHTTEPRFARGNCPQAFPSAIGISPNRDRRNRTFPHPYGIVPFLRKSTGAQTQHWRGLRADSGPFEISSKSANQHATSTDAHLHAPRLQSSDTNGPLPQAPAARRLDRPAARQFDRARLRLGVAEATRPDHDPRLRPVPDLPASRPHPHGKRRRSHPAEVAGRHRRREQSGMHLPGLPPRQDGA